MMINSIWDAFLVLGLFCVTYISCSDVESYPSNSLGAYIEQSNLPVVYHSLIACAASGTDYLLQNDDDNDISVLFYPPQGAQNFKYFQNSNSSNTANSALIELSLNDFPVFNGYLRRFLGEDIEGVGVVTYILEDSLYVSDPIAIHSKTIPTSINPPGTSIDLTNPTSPIFSWEAASLGNDVIYFQVITDRSNNLISGTYTTDRNFTFYDLTNVVLNIRDVNPSPILEPNQTYNFIMMGVSGDNWVNTLVDTTFLTN